jgi:hypothetical protein
MAERERYTLLPLRGTASARTKFAPFSGKSLRAAEAPRLIIEDLDQDERDRWDRCQTISTTICAPQFGEKADQPRRIDPSGP